jgi:outer membrane protein assembly factor BamB
MIVTNYEKGMFGVNAENGELLFTYRYEQRNDILSTRPIYHDGHLFLTANTFQKVGQGAVMLKISVADGKVTLNEVWRNIGFDNVYDGIILLDGFLYGSSSSDYKGGMFMCVDWKTGETRYEAKDVGQGTLTWAEGLIYFISERRNVLLIRPNAEKYEVISRFNIPENGEGLTWAQPVVCGKRMYIRHGAFLYCYDIAQ